MSASEQRDPEPASPDDGQAEIDEEDELLSSLFVERRRESADEPLELWPAAND